MQEWRYLNGISHDKAKNDRIRGIGGADRLCAFISVTEWSSFSQGPLHTPASMCTYYTYNSPGNDEAGIVLSFFLTTRGVLVKLRMQQPWSPNFYNNNV